MDEKLSNVFGEIQMYLREELNYAQFAPMVCKFILNSACPLHMINQTGKKKKKRLIRLKKQD